MSWVRVIVLLVGTFLLVAIGWFCILVLRDNAHYPQSIVMASSAALFGDILGTLLLMWKTLLQRKNVLDVDDVIKGGDEV